MNFALAILCLSGSAAHCCSLGGPAEQFRSWLGQGIPQNVVQTIKHIKAIWNVACLTVLIPKNVSRLKSVFLEIYLENFCKKLVGRQILIVSIYYAPPGLHPTRRKSQCCTRQWLDNVDAQISSHTTLGNLPRKIDGASPQNICNCCYCRHPVYSSLASYIYTTLKVGP